MSTGLGSKCSLLHGAEHHACHADMSWHVICVNVRGTLEDSNMTSSQVTIADAWGMWLHEAGVRVSPFHPRASPVAHPASPLFMPAKRQSSS